MSTAELAVQEQRMISPMQILQAEYRSNPSVELAKQIVELEKASLENSMARQRFEWESQNRQDVVDFSRAMAAFRDEAPTIVRKRSIKDRSGNEKYKATALEDVATPLMKALSSKGIMYRWKSDALPDGRTRVTCLLRLKGTAYEEEGATLAAPPDTEGGKDLLKATGSTASYLEKYTLLMSCGIHVHGTDPEAVPMDCVTNEQAETWIEAIRYPESPEGVMAEWKKSLELAKSFDPIDYKAMSIFTETRDERLKELRRSK